MVYCHVSWDSYKSNISNGYSRLQQTEEFVDMTLAADGHLVKVHKSLLALASPYIKEMIQSAPCPHPVLFLNLISYDVLCYILEYVYTGEVDIPANMMMAFIDATKALHITGVCNLIPPSNIKSQLIEHRENTAMRKKCNTSAGNLNVYENISSAYQNDTITETNLLNTQNIENNITETNLVNNQNINQNLENNITETNLVNSQNINQNLHNIITGTIFVTNQNVNHNLENNITETNLVNTQNINQNLHNIITETNLVANQNINQNLDNNITHTNLVNSQNVNKNLENNITKSNSVNSEIINRNNIIQMHTSNFCIDPVSKEALDNTIVKVESLNNWDTDNDESDYNTMYIEENSAPNVNQEVMNVDPYCASEGRRNNEEIIDVESYFASNSRNEKGAESNNFSTINTTRVNETISNDVNTINHCEPNKGYSIKVVLPTTDNKKPPEITINAGVVKTPIERVEMGASTTQPRTNWSDLTKLPGSNSPLYTTTGRGALLMILNRFMYYEHHKSKKGFKRRWRCIDYRRARCSAYLDTEGEIIVNRKFMHTHGFHDQKIMHRGAWHCVFTSIQEARENTGIK